MHTFYNGYWWTIMIFRTNKDKVSCFFLSLKKFTHVRRKPHTQEDSIDPLVNSTKYSIGTIYFIYSLASSAHNQIPSRKPSTTLERYCTRKQFYFDVCMAWKIEEYLLSIQENENILSLQKID